MAWALDELDALHRKWESTCGRWNRFTIHALSGIEDHALRLQVERRDGEPVGGVQLIAIQDGELLHSAYHENGGSLNVTLSPVSAGPVSLSLLDDFGSGIPLRTTIEVLE